MKTIKFFDLIPQYYQKFLPLKYNINLPDEVDSTCSDCAMINESKSNNIGFSFHPDSKCCTYFPRLKNYQIGSILYDNDCAEGKKIVREIIKNRVGVTPTGIQPSRLYKLLYDHSYHENYGNSKRLICPFFNGIEGKCTIWKHRTAVCQTWFCKPVHGKDGEILWGNVKRFLQYIEIVLSNYILYKQKYLDIISLSFFQEEKSNKPIKFNLEEIDGFVSDINYNKIWKSNLGKEEEFYKSCFMLVNNLKKNDFKRVAGVCGNILFDKMVLSLSAITKFKIPEYLKKSPSLHVYKTDENSYVMYQESSLNVFSIPNVLYDVIDLFDGKHTVNLVKKIAKKQYGVIIDTSLLKTLFHNRILIAQG